jgi:hypothetical protein|nr:MAG TPA: DNA ligase-like protein [Caudoviricetes sp.]
MSIFTDPIPEVFIGNSTFLFSGKFEYGDKGSCYYAVESLGGQIQEQVNGYLDYIVVGKLGNKNWKNGTYGKKIEAAIEMNRKCCTRISIINEDTWKNALENPKERPLDERGKRLDGYNPEKIYPIWHGDINIRFTYSGYWDDEPAEIKEISLREINVKPQNCNIFINRYNANRIQDPIEIIDTGEFYTVDEFLDIALENKFSLKKHSPEKSANFTPMIKIETK